MYQDPRLSTHGILMKTPNNFFSTTSSSALGAAMSSVITTSADAFTTPGIVIGSGLTLRDFTWMMSDGLPEI